MKEKEKFIPALKFHWLTHFYDPIMKISGANKKFNNALLLQAKIRDKDTVLDFGCGTSNLIITLKEEIPKSIVHGVDIDSNILKIAHNKITNRGLEIFLQHYDGTTLPYKDESFDKVLSSLVFHHLNRNRKLIALKEIYRVLTSNGELYILDFGEGKNLITRGLFLPIQIFDGFSNTSDNVKGLVPEIMEGAGFNKVREHKRMLTPLGIISLYSALKT